MLHSGEKPFKCKNCDKAFAQRANLKKHEMIHLNIRPYGCNICLKSYSQQSNLKKHILTHQKKNGKNNKASVPTNNYVIYQCNICKTEIGDIGDFNKHIKICNLNPMNNQQHGMRGSDQQIHQQQQQQHQQQMQQHNGNGMLEPKKEVNIEIKTEIDDGSNTHPPQTPTGSGPATLITIHAPTTQHHQLITTTAANHQSHIQSHPHNTQLHNHQQLQQNLHHHPQQAHQILTTNGHIITNFLELTNSHSLHIEGLHYKH